MGQQTAAETNPGKATIGEAESAVSGESGKQGTTAGSEAAEGVKELQFELLRSALYHDILQRRFMRVHKGLQFLIIVLGSAAVWAIGGQFPIYGQIAGVIIALAGAADLVWDYGGTARDHGALRRQFYDLLTELERSGDVASVRARIPAIYAIEPPTHDRTNHRAHNKAGLSVYGDDFTRV